MLTNSMCLIPGLLLLLKQNQSKVKHLDRKPIITKANDNQLMTSVATICQLLALICWPIIAYFDDNRQFWCIPLCLFLISLSWWENFISHSSTNSLISGLMAAKKDLIESRYFTFAIISIWKIIVVFSTMVSIIYLNDGSHALNITFTNFTDAFNSDTIEIIRDFRHLESSDDETRLMTIKDPLVPIWILLIQLSATYLCYAFAKFSCKIHIQTVSFAIPVHLVVPVTNSLIWVMVELSAQDHCKLSHFFSGFQYIFWFTEDKTAFEYYDNWSNYVLTLIWVLSLASQIMITIHIWKATSARLASTEELFVNPMYNSVLIDQSLALNRRRFNLREEQRQEDEESLKKGDDDFVDSGNYYETLNDSPIPELLKQEELDDTVRIFVCATMWHENKEEMIQMLKAVIRLDEDQFNRRAAQELFKLSPEITDYYEIECKTQLIE